MSATADHLIEITEFTYGEAPQHRKAWPVLRAHPWVSLVGIQMSLTGSQPVYGAGRLGAGLALRDEDCYGRNVRKIDCVVLFLRFEPNGACLRIRRGSWKDDAYLGLLALA